MSKRIAESTSINQPSTKDTSIVVDKASHRPSSEVQKMRGIDVLRNVEDLFLDVSYKVDAAINTYNTVVSGIGRRLLSRILNQSAVAKESAEKITALYERELEYRRDLGKGRVQAEREDQDRFRPDPLLSLEIDLSQSETLKAAQFVGNEVQYRYKQIMGMIGKIDKGLDAVALKLGTAMVEKRGQFADARVRVRVEETAVVEVADPEWMWEAYAERLTQLPIEKRQAEYAALSPEAKACVDVAYHRAYVKGIQQLQRRQGSEK